MTNRWMLSQNVVEEQYRMKTDGWRAQQRNSVFKRKELVLDDQSSQPVPHKGQQLLINHTSLTAEGIQSVSIQRDDGGLSSRSR